MQELYVDTHEDLLALCESLRTAPWLALDTEFIREKTYYPQLCLIQVGDGRLVACVDPLAIDDLSPLLDLIYNPDIIKVMHAGRQDLEIFYNLRGELPSPLFDTQIGATVLGLGEQVGYAGLVKAMLGVDVDKTQTRTDWAQRPLDPEQIEYAADDVRYLGKVYLQQLALLEEKRRLHWLDEEFKALVDPTTFVSQPNEMWRRIKGAGRLKGAQLAVLKELAAWREELAMSSNRPRRWLLSDDVLLDLARHQPSSLARMERIRGLEASTLRKHGEVLLGLIRQALQTPKGEWPVLPPPFRLTPDQEALADALVAILRLRAQQQGVATPTIACRKDVEQLVAGERDLPLLQGWRCSLAGADLLAFLEGELGLCAVDGQLCLTPMTHEPQPNRWREQAP